MRCETFEQRMHALLDNRRRPEVDAQLRAHAAGCRPCKEQLNSQENLFAGLELLELPEPREDLSKVVVEQVIQSDRRRIVQWACIAAAMLVTMGLIPLLRSTTQSVPNPSHLAEQPVANQPGAALNGTRTNGNGTTTDGTVTSGTPVKTGPGDYLVSLAASLPMGQLPESIEELDSVGLAEGLRPLARSFNSAYGLILRTIPVGRDSGDKSPQAEFSSPRAQLTA